MTTFLDTCAVIALLDETHQNHEWSVDEFQKCKQIGPAIICDIVYCEVSVGMATREALDEAIETLGIERISTPDDALFRAGKVFHHYKTANRGPKMGVLPDFLIGATAEAHGASLMTDNVRDYTRHFPTINFISPPPPSPPTSPPTAPATTA